MTTPPNERRAKRILDATARLIAHYGYDKTTVSDIAQAAGVSKGAIYLHWQSKEELFDALIAREMRQLIADFMARVEADADGGSIGGMYRHALLALAANPLMRALYTQDSRILGDYVLRQDPTRYQQRYAAGQQFVAVMQQAGLLRVDLPPDVIAYLMSIVAYGLMRIETIIPATQAPPLESVAGALADVLQRGLAPADGGDSAAGKQALAAVIDLIRRQNEQEPQ